MEAPLLPASRAKSPLHRRSASDSFVLSESEINRSLTLSGLKSSVDLQIADESMPDPKKIKRMLANREAARKWRLKREEYLEKLENDAYAKEIEVYHLMSQLWYYKLERMMLERENYAMKKKFERLANEQARKEAEYETLKEERRVLMLLYKQQQEAKFKLKP